jgi:hypothetical protein
MNQVKKDAQYLFEHWKQSNDKNFVDMLFNRIVKSENLKTMEVAALKNEFRKLIRNNK